MSEPNDTHGSTIVVGVDGSPGSLAALRFAFEEARSRRATVRAVNAWHPPLDAYGQGLAPPSSDLSEEAQRAAGAALERTISEAGDAPDVDLETVLSEGHPVQVLLEEAQGADLLVVGTRGLGGFRGLLLGSVSQQCAHHAECPVVIVPSKRKS